MKNLIKILIGLLLSLFLTWTIFRLFINFITEGKKGESISYSIEESIACGAFVCEFKWTELDSSTRKNLIKYSYIESLDSVQIWLEKGHKYINKNLFLNELQFLDKYHLIVQNPREFKEKRDSTFSIKIIKGKYPDFGIRKSSDFELVSASTTKYTSHKIRFGETTEIRNQSGANRHNFFQRISKVTLDKPSDEVEVWIYLPFMTFQSDDIIAGKIILKRKGTKFNKVFKDKRKWWRKVNL